VIQPAIEIAIATRITIGKISHAAQANIAIHTGAASETKAQLGRQSGSEEITLL
jgi:hypothetical protein